MKGKSAAVAEGGGGRDRRKETILKGAIAGVMRRSDTGSRNEFQGKNELLLYLRGGKESERGEGLRFLSICGSQAVT